VVGYFQPCNPNDPSVEVRGFYYYKGVFQLIDPGVAGSIVTGINDRGEIIGTFDQGNPCCSNYTVFYGFPKYDVQSFWADVNGDGKKDYCRLVGSGASSLESISCGLSSSAGVGMTLTSSPLDPGYTDGRAWVDVNGDGRADFCRVTAAPDGERLLCTLSTGTGFGLTISSGVLDAGYSQGRAWVDINGDGRADYCRVVGTVNFTDSRVVCTLSTGTGFGSDIASSVLDWGYDGGRVWVDFNGDGKADYCRLTGVQNKVVTCTVSTGTAFGSTYSSASLDWVYDAGRSWVDVNGDGKADYCRVIGSTNFTDSRAICTLSTGTGFGVDLTSPVLDWGYDDGRAWVDVNGDGKADFCRVTGENKEDGYLLYSG
jgi:hypothetical protein